LIKFQEEINAVIDELLEEEEEMDITDINNLIYAAATIITQTLNEPSKKKQNLKNCKVLENKNAETNKQLEKELSILAETGTGSDNGKLNRKRRKIFKNIA